MPNPKTVTQPSKAPTRKVTAALVAAALVSGLIGAVEGVCGVEPFAFCGPAMIGIEQFGAYVVAAIPAGIAYLTRERAT
jgi:hypothetical protein